MTTVDPREVARRGLQLSDGGIALTPLDSARLAHGTTTCLILR